MSALMFTRIGTVAVACLLLLGLGGCSKGQGTVSGKVTLEGKALKSGSVLMVGEDQVRYSGDIERDGSYRIENVTFGNIRVAVYSVDPKEQNVPKSKNDRPGKLGGKIPDRPPVDNVGWFPIPADYGDPSKSGLALTVDQPNQVFDIPLKGKGP
jgi:hypothetical protein